MADDQATESLRDELDDNIASSATEHLGSSTAFSDQALLAGAPPTYVLPIRFGEEEIGDLEKLLAAAGATVVHQATQARLILSKLTMPRRAKFELQTRGLATTPLERASTHQGIPSDDASSAAPSEKRRKLAEKDLPGSLLVQDTVSEPMNRIVDRQGNPSTEFSPDFWSDNSTSIVGDSHPSILNSGLGGNSKAVTPQNPIILVVRDTWFRDSLKAGRLLDIAMYLIYQGKATATDSIDTRTSGAITDKVRAGQDLIDDGSLHLRQTSRQSSQAGRRDRMAAAAARDLAGRAFMPSHQPAAGSKRRLLPQTTSEHDEVISLPDLPDWVIQHKIYSCERAAPREPTNHKFVDLLKKIRQARVLVGDEIGVRAYSTSIASIISYPYLIASAKEVAILPGCEQKVANLMSEYLETGHVQAADEVDQDPVLYVLNSFYNIWGVGAASAREFYYDRGWRDHDDIIEYGWSQLNRHQQIGLKYFDEFEQKLSRSEVEFIASVVTFHAKLLVDDRIECVIVGGYRRGKTASGDVDLIISHPDRERTKYLISPLINALEESGWITHTLILTETASARDQETLPLKAVADDQQRRTGFDTLDKALVVWQNPNWTTREKDLSANPQAKNPNVHRRVDIIISPWKTVGCAVAGWTSGTTFQRDLRRYARRVKGWKFDSSGIRDISTGVWVDLEQWSRAQSRAETWLEAEKRVFEGLDLQWRRPEDRNTE